MSQRADYAKEASQEDRHAARAGGGENPHPWGSREFNAWNQGNEGAQDLDRLCQLTRMLEGAA